MDDDNVRVVAAVRQLLAERGIGASDAEIEAALTEVKQCEQVLVLQSAKAESTGKLSG